MQASLQELAGQVSQVVESRRGELVELMQALLRFPSVNPPGLERACNEFIANWLQAQGLGSRLVGATPERPNVVAVWKGSGGGKNLLFYGGHSDVVPEGDRALWRFDPYGGEIENGWIYGRGAADHKGSIASSMIAIAVLRSLGVQLAGDLVYTVVVDEEKGGHAGARWLVENQQVYGDMGLYGGPGYLDQIVICSKGWLQLKITVTGRASHSSAPWLAINPIEKAAKLVQALHALGRSFTKESPHFDKVPRGIRGGPKGVLSVTMIGAGVKENVIPGSCEITVDRRVIPEETPDEALEQIEAVIAGLSAEDPEFNAEITQIINKDRGVLVQPTEPIVDIVRQAAAAISMSARTTGTSGSSDTRWFVNVMGVPMVGYGVGFDGPDGKSRIHAPDECINIDDLVALTKAYALIMVLSCGQQQS